MPYYRHGQSVVKAVPAKSAPLDNCASFSKRYGDLNNTDYVLTQICMNNTDYTFAQICINNTEFYNVNMY